MSPLVRGRKVTENWQEALGAREAQGGVEAKVGVVLVGVVSCRVAEAVLVRVMVCLVEVGAGTVLKMRAVGLRARPGSGLPKPVRGAVTGVVEVGIVRLPL